MTEVSGQAFWDERYRSRNELWSGEPNPHLLSNGSELSVGASIGSTTGRAVTIHDPALRARRRN